MDARFSSSFWCFYRNGRQVLVNSQQELDALAPGWAAKCCVSKIVSWFSGSGCGYNERHFDGR